VPGLIQLQADAMSLAAGQVVADDGAVAIAPLTAGATLSFDAATVAGHLSLTQADLDAIQTVGALGANNGPLGTQTLVLGSLDGATASASTGRLEINAGMALGGIASTLSLFSAGDVVEQGAGAVSVNALTGAALNGHIVLNGANTVARIGGLATVGAFATAGNFVSGLSGGAIDIVDYRDLSVVAPVIATVGSVGIVVHAGAGTPGTLGNASTIQAAAAVGLSADQDIDTTGSVVAGTNAALDAGRDINNGGRVEAGSDASLVAGQNIGNDGVVHGGNDAGLTASNDIDNRGLVDAVRDANLSAQGDIGNGGTVAAGRNTTMAAGTGIVQTGGAILAGESSTGTVTLVAPSITQTGGVIATRPGGGGDMVRLAADGTGSGAGTIALGGALAASQLVLSASGDIDETGTITAGLLTGTAGIAPGGDLPNGTLGSARLTGATPGANRIATLGAFVTTGSLSLSDGQALTIAGPVMTGVIAAANPQVGSNRFGATISVPDDSITVVSNLTAGAAAPGAPAGLVLPGGDIVLSAGGAIVIPGAIEAAADANGGGTLTTTGGSSINESGAISAAVLAGSAGGAANFAGDGAASNAIRSLGAFTAGDFGLTDGSDLLVAGPVTAGAGSVALTTHAGHGTAGTLTNGAVVTAIGNVSLAADADARSGGAVTAGQAVTMRAGGTLAVSGPVSAASDVTLAAGADLVQTSGAITAGRDAALGAGRGITQQAGGTMGAARAVSMTANAITLAGSTVAGSAVALDARTDITQAGIIRAGSDAALSAGHDITQQAGGTISAGETVSLAAGQAPPGTLGGLTLGGIISGATVRLSAPQDIVETGAISAATLSGNAGLAPSAALPDGVLGSATLTGATPGANRIGTLGAFLTTGSLVVNDGQALTIAGPVTTGAIAAANADVAGRTFGATITAPAIAVAGQLTAGLPAPGASGASLPGGDVILTAGGSIELAGILAAQPGSNGGGSFAVTAGAGLHQSGGAVIAGVLRGAAGGSVTLDAGQNRIGSIGDFTVLPAATGNFRLTDTGNLRLAGTLTSNLIVISDTAGQVILDDGAAIVTGGIARPDGAFRAPVESDGGAFLTDFVQLGRSTVTGIHGGPSTLVITALANGSILFDSRTSSSGLYAPETWLVLTLGNPSGVGTLGSARGNVFVRSLDLQFRGTGGQSDLGGTIANLSGAVAAGSAGISPRMDANYRFNACPIHSVHCVILAVEGLPPGSPLEDFSIAVLADRDSDEDLLLPIISDRDYTLTGGKGDHDLLLPIISDRDY
jgi:filamentous hemagglutinin